MSSTRHHIPFPRTFLSLNTPTKKSVNPTDPLAAAASQPEQSAHPFLSNRSTGVARHASISSVSSVDSVAGETSAPTPEPSASPVVKPTLPAFLSLNTKYSAPPSTAKEMNAIEKHGFLSNRV